MSERDNTIFNPHPLHYSANFNQYCSLLEIEHSVMFIFFTQLVVTGKPGNLRKMHIKRGTIQTGAIAFAFIGSMKDNGTVIIQLFFPTNL